MRNIGAGSIRRSLESTRTQILAGLWRGNFNPVTERVSSRFRNRETPPSWNSITLPLSYCNTVGSRSESRRMRSQTKKTVFPD